MSDTRILAKSAPRTTGIPNHVTSNIRPIVSGSSGVSASPSAGAGAQKVAQKHHGISPPAPRPGAPATLLLEKTPQRAGGRPPEAVRVALVEPPLTVDQINVIGPLVVDKMNAEGTSDADKEVLYGILNALGALLEKTMAAMTTRHTRAEAPTPVEGVKAAAATPIAGAGPAVEVVKTPSAPSESAPTVATATPGTNLANDLG